MLKLSAMQRKILCGTVIAFSLSGSAQLSAQPTGLSPDEIDRRVSQAVEKLNSPKFLDRESGAEELLVLGPAILPLLQSRLDGFNLEQRLRLQDLIGQLKKNEFDYHLGRFITKEAEETDADFPCWRAFSKVVGDNDETRKFYAAAYRTDRDFLKLAQEGSETAQRESANLRISLAMQTTNLGLEQSKNPWAAMLIAGVASEKKLGIATTRFINSLAASNEGVTLETFGPPTIARPAIVHLLGQGETPADLAAAMGVCVGLKLNEGVAIAEKYLKSDTSDFNTLRYALVTLAKLGSEEQIPLVEKYLDFGSENSAALDRPEPIQDLALLALIHLSRKSPADFGLGEHFPASRDDIRANRFDYTIFVPEVREKAREQWKKSRAEVPPPPQ